METDLVYAYSGAVRACTRNMLLSGGNLNLLVGTLLLLVST